MRDTLRRLRGLVSVALREQAGITGLSTSVIWMTTIIVSVAFGTTMITVGQLVTHTTEESVRSTVQHTASTLKIKGAVFAEETTTGGKVARIKFKLALAAGSESVDLNSARTLLTYIDANNRVPLPYTGSNADTEPWWSHVWVLGEGEAVDEGDIVEITVGMVSVGGEALKPMVGPNETFKIEVLPAYGVVIPVQRTTPLRFRKVMNLG